ASVNDLATNTGGSLLGALVLVVVVRDLAGRAEDRSYVGLPSSVFALAYGGAVAGEAFLPLFRQGVVATGGPLQRMGATLGAFRWGSVLDAPFGDFLLFLPAGIFAVAAL